MFNTFVQTTAEDLLNQVCSAPMADIEKSVDPNRLLNHNEMVDLVIEEFSNSKEEAEQIVTQIQLEEFYNTVGSLVEKGLVEITGYDEDGQPEYGLTELGNKTFPK